MAKRNRKKQAAAPYEFIQEVNKMTKDQIVKRFIHSFTKHCILLRYT